MPDDASEQDIISLAMMARNSVVDDNTWMPKNAVYIGPGQSTNDGFNPNRIKVFYNENRKITDIGIG